MSDIREKLIEKIKSIPAIPVSAAKAIRLLQDQDKNLSEAIRLIEYDPGLTTNILKLVNSSAFAAERKITSLQEAMVRLGAKNILQMLIGSSMAPVMNLPVAGYDIPPGELWRSAVTAAIYTDEIKRILKLNLPPHAFTAALIHDIGKIALASFIQLNPEEIISYAQSRGISFVQAEQEKLGVNHTEAGMILLKAWNLPEVFEKPIMYHHEPEKADGDVVTEIVHIADALTMMEGIGTGNEGLHYKISDSIFEKYKLDVDVLEHIICSVQIKRDELKDMFS